LIGHLPRWPFQDSSTLGLFASFAFLALAVLMLFSRWAQRVAASRNICGLPMDMQSCPETAWQGEARS
jgi:hypothetical protein